MHSLWASSPYILVACTMLICKKKLSSCRTKKEQTKDVAISLYLMSYAFLHHVTKRNYI